MYQNPLICRLCLEPVDPNSVVVLNHDTALTESILQITTVEVMVHPSCQVFMCNQCHTMLDQSMQFRTVCIQNDYTFRNIYAKLIGCSDSMKDEPTEPEAVLVQCKLEEVESQGSDLESGAMVNKLEPEIDILEPEQNLPKPRKPRKKSKPAINILEPEQDLPKPRKPRKKYTKKEKVPKDRSEKVQCPICGALISKNNLYMHKRTHDQNRIMYSCTLCPKKYTKNRQLKEHITIVHEKKMEHTCDRCGKAFFRSETLNQHILANHTDIKKYACKICGEKFARIATRHYHVQMHHTTEKPYSCEYCLKSFKRSGDLQIHVRTHTGEKPFKCNLCDYRTGKSYNLVIHKKSHQNADMRRDAKTMVVEGAAEKIDWML